MEARKKYTVVSTRMISRKNSTNPPVRLIRARSITTFDLIAMVSR